MIPAWLEHRNSRELVLMIEGFDINTGMTQGRAFAIGYELAAGVPLLIKAVSLAPFRGLDAIPLDAKALRAGLA